MVWWDGGTEDGRCHQPILSSSPPTVVIFLDITVLDLDQRLLQHHLHHLLSITRYNPCPCPRSLFSSLILIHHPNLSSSPPSSLSLIFIHIIFNITFTFTFDQSDQGSCDVCLIYQLIPFYSVSSLKNLPSIIHRSF